MLPQRSHVACTPLKTFPNILEMTERRPNLRGVCIDVLQRKTGECFGLNGAIFLGSILLWDYALAPGMRWMLTGLRSWAGPTGAEALLALLKATFVVWWLLPVYCISFALSCVW